MEYIDTIRKKAHKALEELGSSSDLELMKESHRTAVKDLLKIVCMADEIGEGGYSNDGYSERRHYVRGHYSRAGGSYDGYSGARRDGMGHYSRTDAKREMMGYAEAAMDAAPDDMTRTAAREFRDKIDRL